MNDYYPDDEYEREQEREAGRFTDRLMRYLEDGGRGR